MRLSGRVVSLRRQIYSFLKVQGRPLTRSEVASFLHVKENSVNPRVRELLDEGMLFEVGTRKVNGFSRKTLSVNPDLGFVHNNYIPTSRYII